MNIQDITKQLSKPTPIEAIDWRVQSIKKTKNGVGMIVLGYKDARYDMSVLDEITGGAWTTEYKRDTKGVLQCTIGIYAQMPDGVYQWIHKTSNGVESFSDAAKGEYSDSFKRAGFMWGIGRDLYELPFIWINLDEGEYYEATGGKIRNSLNPNDLTWYRENGLLTAKDNKGKVRFKERRSNATQAKTNETKIDKPKSIWEQKRPLFVSKLQQEKPKMVDTGLPTKGIAAMITKALNEYKAPASDIIAAFKEVGIDVKEESIK